MDIQAFLIVPLLLDQDQFAPLLLLTHHFRWYSIHSDNLPLP